MTDGQLKIHLNIAGRTFPLHIERAKEERYRRAEREVNAMIKRFKESYRAESEEDYLAMAALQISLMNVENELRGSVDSEQERLRRLEKQIDDYLNQPA